MCVLKSSPAPKVDYGQGSQAWNPNKRDDVYQQVERAKSDDGFARSFAADILFGKPSGDSWFTYETPKGPHHSSEENRGDDVPRTPRLVEKQAKRGSALYNENTLNASKSWVTQAFGAPVVKGADGNWYEAKALVGSGGTSQGPGGQVMFANKNSTPDYGFMAGARLTDANTVRLLNEGHHAFSAKGYDGSEVYVPWADGFAPGKGGGGKPEAGNAKKELAQGATARDMVTAVTAKPGNVIGGAAAGGGAETLLSGALKNAKKTLLGGSS